MKMVRLKLQNGEHIYVNQDVIMAVGQANKDGAVMVGVSVLQTVSGTVFAINMVPRELADLVSDGIVEDQDEPQPPITLTAIHGRE